MNLVYVFIGGGLGSLLRYGISLLVKRNFAAVFPVATLVSNLLSCILLVLTYNFLVSKGENNMLKLLLITGFCGGFSTFSAFSFETVELIRTGNTLFAILNILLSLFCCLGLVYMLVRDHA